MEHGGDSDEDRKKDRKALAAIGLRVKKHHLITVEQAETSKGSLGHLPVNVQGKEQLKQICSQEAAQHTQEAAFGTHYQVCRQSQAQNRSHRNPSASIATDQGISRRTVGKESGMSKREEAHIAQLHLEHLSPTRGMVNG